VLSTIAGVSELSQSGHVTAQEPEEQNRLEGIGCAWALLGVNTVLIGLLTASFVQGPYSSNEQELWYRYGSLGFFFAGSVLPATALLVARRSRGVVVTAMAWMLITLLAFAWFALMAGGGI
jgi:hypothetical protein